MVPRETMLQALPCRTFERAGKALLQLRRYLAIHRTGENHSRPILQAPPSRKIHLCQTNQKESLTKKKLEHVLKQLEKHIIFPNQPNRPQHINPPDPHRYPLVICYITMERSTIEIVVIFPATKW